MLWAGFFVSADWAFTVGAVKSPVGFLLPWRSCCHSAVRNSSKKKKKGRSFSAFSRNAAQLNSDRRLIPPPTTFHTGAPTQIEPPDSPVHACASRSVCCFPVRRQFAVKPAAVDFVGRPLHAVDRLDWKVGFAHRGMLFRSVRFVFTTDGNCCADRVFVLF